MVTLAMGLFLGGAVSDRNGPFHFQSEFYLDSLISIEVKSHPPKIELVSQKLDEDGFRGRCDELDDGTNQTQMLTADGSGQLQPALSSDSQLSVPNEPDCCNQDPLRILGRSQDPSGEICDELP